MPNRLSSFLALCCLIALWSSCSSDTPVGSSPELSEDATERPTDTPTPGDGASEDIPPGEEDTGSSTQDTPSDIAADDTLSPEATSGPDALEADTGGADETDTTEWTGIGPQCFAEIWSPEASGPDYDQYEPIVGSHCLGTNHQDIEDVEEVVFLGDSVTVGTPNATHLLWLDNSHFFRNLLAEWLAEHFDLDRGELLISWGNWKAYDYFSGKGANLVSGDFRNCSKWGARTDDLLEGGKQIPECFPEEGSEKRTLIVFTLGGNDISSIAQKGAEASEEEVEAGYPAIWKQAEETIDYLDEGLAWLRDPARFPNGSYVVFATPFEFTDGTGDIESCTPQSTLEIPGIGSIDLSDFEISVAVLAGYGPWAKPEVQEAVVIWLLEEMMALAVKHQVDLTFLTETFCGHGYVATGPKADTENRCYRGPEAELYFDETCTHPSDAGHAALYELFRAVIEE